MKRIIILILTIGFVSCQSNLLKQEFACETNADFSELKEYRDFLKHFRVQVPKNWKTSLYYDEYSSDIYSADTTKQLTDSYVLEMSWKQGELKLDGAFAKNINEKLHFEEKLKVTKSGFGKFKKKPMYFNLSEGIRSGINYKYLQIFIQTNIDEYITLTSKIFGDKLVDERLCQSVELFDSLELIE